MLSVAIDGPSGVGKSTVSKLVANKLGWHCLDTGALYRAIAVACLRAKIDIKNIEEVKALLNKIVIDVKFENGIQHTYLNGEDVTKFLRTEEMDMLSSVTSAYKEVRNSIIDLQRNLAKQENLVVEGRDITSNVLKESKNKFYLDATAEERAKRRYKERIDRGEKVNYNDILEDLIQRDKNDMTRKVAPLVCTKDSIKIDTTSLTINEVVEEILENVKLN